jgi:exonuclease SbcC
VNYLKREVINLSFKISRIKIKDYLGVEELDWNPDKNLNLIEGPKGSGKSSILESLETAFSNNKRRTEVIRHGKDEALLFVETDNELSIDRRIRPKEGKSDYLKLSKSGEGIKSTEGQLRQFISGDIFRPLDFINLDVDEQTEIILNMIEMDYSDQEIIEWFNGEEELLSKINTDKHILQILKDIESKYYKDRREIKREIKTLESQIKGIVQDLPDNYDGEKWKQEQLKDYYDKISEAQKLNNKIEKAESLINNFEDKIKSIKSEAESEKSRVEMKYKDKKQDIKDLIQIKKDKIKDLNNNLNQLDNKKDKRFNKVDSWLEKKIQELKEQAENKKEEIKQDIIDKKENKKENIQLHKEKISSKKSELNGLDEQKEIEVNNIKKGMEAKIKKEENDIKKAKEFINNNEKKDIEPLQDEADKVEEMKSFVNEWDRMIRIKQKELIPRKDKSEHITNLIEIARDKPSELLKIHELPIQGISVDSEGRIRIDGTLLDGLSTGEQLENACKIALQRMGDLRIICLDGIDRLNESEQKKVVDFCKENDVQAFVTRTVDTDSGEFEIKNDFDSGLFANQED